MNGPGVLLLLGLRVGAKGSLAHSLLLKHNSRHLKHERRKKLVAQVVSYQNQAQSLK